MIFSKEIWTFVLFLKNRPILLIKLKEKFTISALKFLEQLRVIWEFPEINLMKRPGPGSSAIL